MAEIAQAAGLSRQALYYRFDSKEAVLKWVLTTITGESLKDTEAISSDETKPLPDRLVQMYDTWAGQHLDVLRHTPNGREIFSVGYRMMESDADSEAYQAEKKVMQQIAALLRKSGLAKSPAAARDMAFALNCASSGLMLIAESRADYVAGIKRVVSAILAKS